MACKLCGEKSEKTIRVSFCPKCKSRNVKYVFGLWNLFGAIPKMRCEKCGNEAVTFPVLVTNKKLLAESGNARVGKGKRKVGGKKK